LSHWLATKQLTWLLPVVILAAGVGAAAVSFFAYAPAKGADAFDYLLHAAYLGGADLPSSLASFQPVYPLLLYGFDHLPGGLYLLIVVQQMLSVLQGVLYFFALRPFSLIVAFLTGLVVALDMQSRVLFNFIATEAPYMFLLALAFYLLMRQIREAPLRWRLAGDIALALTLVALAFTRSVGQPIIFAALLVFLPGTRSWRRTLLIGVTFAFGAWLFLTVYGLVFPRVNLAGENNNQHMIAQPLFRSGLLQAQNGPASQQVLQLQQVCADTQKFTIVLRCMSDQLEGGRPEFVRLLREAYIELLKARPLAYVQGTLNQFIEFLSLTGHQLPADAPTPASVQCQGIEAIVDENYRNYLQNDILLSTAQAINTDALRAAIRDSAYRLCPPLPENTQARSLVDSIGFRYRSLSRPQPLLWYSLLALGILLFPFARRLWPAALSAFLILSAHAALSAVVYNVQPRYTMVTNPFKAILLVLLVYIVGRALAQLIDRWMARRQLVTTTQG
jgi:hypothetical protein